MKVKVFIFSQTLLKGGAEKQAILLAISLKDLYDVTIIIFYPKKIDGHHLNILNENEINVLKLDGNFFIKVCKLLKAINGNTIIFNYLFLPNVLGGIISKLKKHTLSIGGIRSARLKNGKRKVERFVHNRVNDFTIFNNQTGVNNSLIHGFKRDKIIYIPNVLFPLPKFDQKDLSRNSFNILTVGRFEQVKNFPFALEVISKIISQGYQITYTIVGWGSLENKIRGIINNLGIDNYVKIVINPENLELYYKNADLYIQTSKFEGISNTILEAMSYGNPVIATDAGDNRFIIRNNVEGFIIEQKNIDDFISKIKFFLDDKKQLEIFGYRAYQRIKDEYSISRFKTSYINLIENYK